jgi:DNA-directed RNA polymerase specialized sigma subunit
MTWLEIYEFRQRRKQTFLPVLSDEKLTIDQMAALLRISKGRVSQLRKEMGLPGRKRGPKAKPCPN